ncbi:MAG: nucleotide exchange factor GrpE [Marinobacterium sp.]|nr:nucleotide exchange factor GrpE [Marinobacterium sp.]
MANEEKTQADNVTEAQVAEETVAAQPEAAQADPDAGMQLDVAELMQQLSVAQAEAAKVAEFQDQALRAQAETQNIRRRAEQDVEKAHKFALEKFANEMLQIVDNLERALDAADAEDEKIKPLREGVEMTLNMFVSSLAKFSVEQIAPQPGDAFNPELHQAMSMVPGGEVASGCVVAAMQKGYTLSGRLLRPAMVMVAQ